MCTVAKSACHGCQGALLNRGLGTYSSVMNHLTERQQLGLFNETRQLFLRLCGVDHCCCAVDTLYGRNFSTTEG